MYNIGIMNNVKKNKFLIWLKKIFINFLLLFTKKIYIPTEKIKELDKDNNGNISLEEILLPFANFKIVKRILNFIIKFVPTISIKLEKVLAIDTDKDGKITLKEFWNFIKSFKKNKK